MTRRPLTQRRLVILSEGAFGVIDAKTAAAIIRYVPDNVVAVIDSTKAGRDTAEFLGYGAGIPIVASFDEALAHRPDTLLIGIAPPGGGLPAAWRTTIATALRHGLHIVSGLHDYLTDDPEFAAVARERGVDIWDVRRPPADLSITEPNARINAKVVLTVGTDCKVGKKITAIELDRAACAAGMRSKFIATGQTGVMLDGNGICVDSVVSDFIAGAAQRMVMEHHNDFDWLFVEGQGSLYHPAYSGVTLGLLHGSAPDALILCHDVDLTHVKRYHVRIPPLSEVARAHELAAGWVKPCLVVGIALNCYQHSDEVACQFIEATEAEAGLPTTDVVKFGATKLIEALRR